MPDNANPIIHGRSDSAPNKRRTAFLEDSDEEDWFSLGEINDAASASGSGSSIGGRDGTANGDEEPIDAEEIFGMRFLIPRRSSRED